MDICPLKYSFIKQSVLRIWLESDDEDKSREMQFVLNTAINQFNNQRLSKASILKVNDGLSMLISSMLTEELDLSVLHSVHDLIKTYNTNYLNKSSSFPPSSASYIPVLKAMSSKKHVSADFAALANTMLNDMIAMCEDGNNVMRPASFIYRLIIYVCTCCNKLNKKEKQEALKVAIVTFDKAVKAISPSTELYGSFLRACCLLGTNETRSKLIRLIFKQCCKDGLLDDNILRAIRLNVGVKELRDIIGGSVGSNSINLSDFPDSWSRNITSKKVT